MFHIFFLYIWILPGKKDKFKINTILLLSDGIPWLYPDENHGWGIAKQPVLSSPVFAHGAMGRQIDPSWGGPIELFVIPASVP